MRTLAGLPETDPVATIGALAARLERRPLVGRARDADGTRRRVRIDGPAFAQLVNDAGYYFAIYRDLLAAARALRDGDPAPLLRLAAEDLTAVDAGPGHLVLRGRVRRRRLPRLPDDLEPGLELRPRRAELAAARAALAPDAFAPFSTATWLGSLYEHQLVFGCLRWPVPAVPDPPAPPGAAYPAVPVLVLNGDLDVITPSADAARAAADFPAATYVPVPNAVHVTALADFDRCASGIVRRFIRTLDAGDTSCAGRTTEVHVVDRFPRRTAGAPATATPAAGDRSRPLDRRAAWVAGQVVADAIARYWLMYGSKGHGLRGGRFTVRGAYLSLAPLRFSFDGARFTRDLAVDGRATWDRRARGVAARLRLTGARRGTLRIVLVDDAAAGDGGDQRADRRPHRAAADAGALASGFTRRHRGRRRRATARGADRRPAAAAAWTPASCRAGARSGRRPSRPPTRRERARAAARSASRVRRAHAPAGCTR